MRVRSTTTGGFTEQNVRRRYTRSRCDVGYTEIAPVVTYTGVEVVKTISDTVTPDFHTRRKCGKFLPLNPMEISTVTTTRVAGEGDRLHYYTSSTSLGGPCYRSKDSGPSWGLYPWQLTLPEWDENIISSVVTDAIADSREAIFDALTFAAEAADTARMLAQYNGQVTDYANRAAEYARRRVRDGRWKGSARAAKDTLQFFSSKWLEYRYGWAPLMYSAQDAYKALSKVAKEGDILRGKARLDVTLDDATTTIVPAWSSQGTLTSIESLTGTRSYRGSAYAELLNPAMHRAGGDPFVTAWEVVPFSFVVDWFVNVGNWIKAMSPMQGARFLGSMGSVKDTYTHRQDVEIDFDEPNTMGTYSGRSTELKVERYTRFVHSGGVLPSWNPRLNTVRIVDLAALAYQNRRKIMKTLFD